MPAFFWSQGFLSIGVNYDPLRRCVKSRILTDALFAPPTSPGGADCITNPCCISFGRAVSDSSLSLRRCDNRYAVRIKQERSVHIRTQPRPQSFPLKNGWGGKSPTHFLREKPWGRGWYAHTPVRTAEIWGKYIFYFLKIFSSLNRMTDTSFAFNGVFSCVSIYIFFMLYYSINGQRGILYMVGRQTRDWALLQFSRLHNHKDVDIDGVVTKLCPSGPGPVVQTMDCTIHRINPHYQADQYHGETNYLIHGIEIYQLGLMLCDGSDSLTNFP